MKEQQEQLQMFEFKSEIGVDFYVVYDENIIKKHKLLTLLKKHIQKHKQEIINDKMYNDVGRGYTLLRYETMLVIENYLHNIAMQKIQESEQM